MRIVERQITEEEYIESIDNPSSFRRKTYESIPSDWMYGYGYYGFKTEKRPDGYFILHQIGNSCD